MSVKDWHESDFGQPGRQAILRRDQRRLPARQRLQRHQPLHCPTIIATTKRFDYHPNKYNFFNAAVAMNEYSEPPDYSAGPIWAIFDADAVSARRLEGRRRPTSIPTDIFSAAIRLPELAAAIKNEYQAKPMKGEILAGDRGNATTPLSMPARTPTSASRRRSTKSKSRLSTPPGRRPMCTTRAPACASTPNAK